MATNVFRAYTRAKTEQWEVPESTRANDVVIQKVDGRPGVALTSPPGATSTDTLPNGDTWTHSVAGVGNRPGSAQVATDGDFILTVAGVSAGQTTGTGTTGTPAGTAVYATVDSNGVVTGLSLTEGSNTKIGVIAPDANIIGTKAPVSIGVDL